MPADRYGFRWLCCSHPPEEIIPMSTVGSQPPRAICPRYTLHDYGGFFRYWFAHTFHHGIAMGVLHTLCTPSLDTQSTTYSVPCKNSCHISRA